MHKAIFFDLGKVLIHFDFRRGYQALEGHTTLPAAELPRRLAGSGLVEQLETGQIESHDFFLRIASLLELRLDYDEFRRLWSCIFTDILIPESMLETLAARYRLILISNTNALHYEVLERRYGHLLRHFHHRVLSHEVRAMKPDARIFQAALNVAGCRPEECFYTDDILSFVEAARALGIDAVQFESCEQITRELRARGLW
jgi:putative hydrolase of the HAD superfamily